MEKKKKNEMPIAQAGFQIANQLLVTKEKCLFSQICNGTFHNV